MPRPLPFIAAISSADHIVNHYCCSWQSVGKVLACSQPGGSTFVPRITSVANMLCQADAYYRCPYDDGALSVTIHQPGYEHQVDHLVLQLSDDTVYAKRNRHSLSTSF